jgi:hypothetical protein
VGVLAGLISSVEASGLVIFDISKTDFYSTSKAPVYLAYNPTKDVITYKSMAIQSGEANLLG